MTQLLEQAMAEVSKMPATVQDTIATLVLDELRDEARWETAFEQTNDAQWDAMIQQVTALITGAAAGFGRALAERLLAEGARVAALNRFGPAVADETRSILERIDDFDLLLELTGPVIEAPDSAAWLRALRHVCDP